ncbi:hypothetical protein [Actinoplanes sp. L3-i22]|uniref:hypothetical protein n=1 Tax=Actinoplanes sp. L3-i22 TaxID=2836373 RepID=UPI001C754417|nr:hypothetical protein [Actinoplanes sp. L3-i22]BCY05512.1 hypothetical protein L3i22_006000 [Actinoplanes sp. L3-i22]
MAGGCVLGGVLFLPAVLPLMIATSPGLSAPIPQAGVAVVLAGAVTLMIVVWG